MPIALVTGGTGFIGTNLIHELLKRNWLVYYTGRPKEQEYHSNAIFLEKNFTDINWENIPKVDVLFHQAAITDTTLQDEYQMYQVNTWDSIRLFDQVVSVGCRHIVYASSCAVYGDAPTPFQENGPAHPLNHYGKSKLLLDQMAMPWAKNKNINITALRYSNVYGRHESHKGKNTCMVTQIGNQMIRDNPRLFTDGNQKRDFVYVKDVVNYNIAATECKGQNILNAGSGTSTSFNEVVNIFNQHLNLDRKPVYIENPYQKHYQNKTLCDMTKTRKLLNINTSWSLNDAIHDYFLPFVR